MALDLEHFNADPWDLNDIVPNDIEVICFHHFIPFLYFFSYFVHLALVLASTYLLLMITDFKIMSVFSVCLHSLLFLLFLSSIVKFHIQKCIIQ